MEQSDWQTRPVPIDSRVTFSTDACVDDEGLPVTPTDPLPPQLVTQKGSQVVSMSSTRSPPPSSILEIALSSSSLAPFALRPPSRCISPPPSPPTPPTPELRRRQLPEGYEVIPFISSDEDDDGRLSRSLTPPLHDFLSPVPELTPDDDDDEEPVWRTSRRMDHKRRRSKDEPLPPSPPRTPSPQIDSAAFSNVWATAPMRPEGTVSAPPSPSRHPHLDFASFVKAADRKPRLSDGPTARRVCSGSHGCFGYVVEHGGACKWQPHCAWRFAVRTRAIEEGSLRVRKAGEEVVELEFRSLRRPSGREVRERDIEPLESDAQRWEREMGHGLQLSFGPEPPGFSAGAHEDQRVDAARRCDDPHSLDYFEANFQSLPLLRLRHALSLAATFAALPDSTRRRSKDAPKLPSSPCYTPPSARGAGAPAAIGSMVSQQYRLYAMGRAKAQRTGGVGYWEGGTAAWDCLLLD
ncbi:hypothetical protein Rhopal_003201-T1 [Rhodotorula paludigena]|uniref:Proteophosphoglycan ppg4 n=1 Tax=Rhodotorula paludigena TaxID=86838 RepID=A0AAV5GME0_9BASI|nr:hypothetical protein Rhopal_003201-T1 [Rhodotorula paludigena]